MRVDHDVERDEAGCVARVWQRCLTECLYDGGVSVSSGGLTAIHTVPYHALTWLPLTVSQCEQVSAKPRAADFASVGV